MSEFLSIPQLADRFGVTPRAIRERIKRRGVYSGRLTNFRVPEAEVRDFAARIGLSPERTA